MPINTGVIESYAALGEDGGLTARLFYDPVLTGGQVVPANQPIRDVDGAALTFENTSLSDGRVRVAGPSGTLAGMLGLDADEDVTVSPGSSSFTAAEVADGLGILTRADVAEFSIGSA